ncbi:RagB/SusD family nutrient uptake outer membrane protein [Flavobacterium sp. FlaQc-48]|uniref:RagB/SusD family nutrient uptake outer membrane protein n=1 Tax=Flavobacterium sp. FlaQc-48 TaxID=3374181 RepID=UPI0037570CAD
MKKYNSTSDFYFSFFSAWKKIKLSFVLMLFALAILSCDNFVEVDLPNSQLTASTVFEEKTTANAAMTQVYSKMRDAGLFTGYSTGISNLLGNYTDELKFYGNTQEGPANFYNNVILPSNTSIKSLWNNSYNQIYGANAVLEGVTASVALSEFDRNQLKGEALFTRAFIHFYLAGLFGNIPYVTTTNYQLNKSISKEPSKEIYHHCIEDLKLAIQYLSASYVTPDRTRPNKYAAKALLSKILLYTEQWAEASNEASAVLNNTALYPFEGNLSKIFLKGSTSTIWQFSSNTPAGNTLEAQTFIFTAGPPPLSALSETLMGSFQPMDQRKTAWTTAVSNGIITWYYPSKYKNKGNGSSTEFSILLRLSELYLIRAEARTHNGDLTGGKEDLNKIRNTAGLTNTTAISKQEILQAILKERQLEFFTEFGHRFFDLKRFDAIDSVLLGSKPQWDSFKAILPIPESELILNTNLNPQNTGY